MTTNYEAALAAAFAAPFTAWTGPTGGCGRAYVVLVGLDRKGSNAVTKACKKLGILFLKKAYGTGNNALYIGYDNGTGIHLAKSEAIATALRANGVPCYADAVGD